MAQESLQVEVDEFLKEFKSLIPTVDKLYLVYRKDGKTQDTLIELGYIKKNVHAELLQLTHLEYSKHEADRDRENSPDMWFFGKRINGKEIYIKIKKHKSGTKGVCISFHEAEWPIKYAFKPENS
jgi:hypothetical protein